MRCYNLDLKKRPYLNDTRNWFLLACETGMRYSDYKQLHKSNLKEVVDGYDFNYEPRKTSKSSKMRVTVPLSGNVIHILLQYGFDMPRPVSNQKMNKGLKEVSNPFVALIKLLVHILPAERLQPYALQRRLCFQCKPL
ncbi:MAG: hypothetical protein IPH31_18730 [Lewinellaceae bacterium]|nr:hypothetical protein [Lewinellaceae bacterium]